MRKLSYCTLFLLWQIDENLSDSSSTDEDFDSIFKELKSKWLLTEIDHCVSKTCNDAFWKLGLLYFAKLHSAYGRKKKTPQFNSIRRNMHNNLLPKIDIEVAYKNRTSGEIVTVNDNITHTKRFPQTQYEKLYEIGTLKVMLRVFVHQYSPTKLLNFFNQTDPLKMTTTKIPRLTI